MNQTIRKRIEDINNGIVPEGYKQTIVGVCPVKWEEHTLADFLRFKNGLNKEKSAFGSGTPIVNYTDVWKKRGLRAKDIKGRVQLSENEINNYEAREGDVFFTRTSETIDEIGFSSVLLEPIENAVFSGFVLRGRPYNDMVVKEYHQYCYSSDLMRSEIKKRSSMTTRALTSGPMLSEVAINLPDRTEQGKIAEILMKWDEMVELQEQYIQKLELRKKAIMKKLLTPKDGWEKWKLVDLVESMSSGGTPSTKNTEYYGGNIVWVSIDDMSKAGKYIDTSARKITKLGLENSSAKLFPENTILYAMYASIGKTVISTIPCTTSQAILGIIVDKEKVDNQYLYYYLLNLQDKIILKGQKGTQANLNKEMVEKFDISLPKDLDEQKNISKILIRADEEISLQKEKLAKIKEQRKAMQQYLLTGVVRVG